ncbi:MAG TPA: glycosyltransferase family 39 protein, partial [Vicinamibacteria bacterium]|nr:glycosyltransferase family 39 protein [Vicinamibacteria bacterium]
MSDRRADPPRLARRAEALAVAGLLAVFVAWSVHRVQHPALHSDELLFATPALGAGGATYDPWFHLPLMVGGYLGALKAYLFMPILAALSPGPAVIRVPSVLLAAAALLGFWLFARRTGGRAAALLVLGLIALCPSYTFAARVDWGPTVLMQVLKAAALLALYRLVEERRPRQLWALAAIAALGLYDKLNFVWVINALGLAAVAAHAARLGEIARAHPRRFWLPLAVLVLGTAALFVGAILTLLPETHPQQAGFTRAQRVAFTLSIIART